MVVEGGKVMREGIACVHLPAAATLRKREAREEERKRKRKKSLRGGYEQSAIIEKHFMVTNPLLVADTIHSSMLSPGGANKCV